MAALLCDFSVWAERYSLSALIFFLSLRAIVQGRNEKEKSFFLFSLSLSLSLSAQPRSVKAVCRALNKLIPYLWGSGTIYPGCNVIRGQGGEQGPSRCSAWLTHTHFITWHCSFFPLHPHLDSLQGDYAAVTGNGKIAYSSPVIRVAPK